MDLNQLRSFYEVTRERSFTRAADKLFLTQPAISLQIKALEEELGESLFERLRRNLRPTPAGEILCGHAQAIFAQVEVARQEIAALRDEVRGLLAIGTSDTNCTYILPGVLQEFTENYPGVEFDIRNKTSPEVLRLVLENEVDFGLATLPVGHRDLVSETLFERRDVLICRPDHPLGERKYVRLQEVADHPLLALEQSSTSRRLMDDAFRQTGVSPRVAMSLGSIEVIKQFVEIGMGMALVPQVAVGEEVQAGRLVAIRVRGLEIRAIGLVEHRKKRRSPAAEAFLHTLKEHLGKKTW